jgi:hypothetical protein
LIKSVVRVNEFFIFFTAVAALGSNPCLLTPGAPSMALRIVVHTIQPLENKDYYPELQLSSLSGGYVPVVDHDFCFILTRLHGDEAR